MNGTIIGKNVEKKKSTLQSIQYFELLLGCQN